MRFMSIIGTFSGYTFGSYKSVKLRSSYVVRILTAEYATNLSVHKHYANCRCNSILTQYCYMYIVDIRGSSNEI